MLYWKIRSPFVETGISEEFAYLAEISSIDATMS
jgi:hypothetical protein